MTFLIRALVISTSILVIASVYAQTSSQSPPQLETLQAINKTLNDLRDVPHVKNILSHVENCTYKIDRLFVEGDNTTVVDQSVSFTINHVSLQPVILRRNYKGVGLVCLNNDECLAVSTYHFIDGNAENGAELASSSKQAEYSIQSIEDRYIEDAQKMGHAFDTLKGACE